MEKVKLIISAINELVRVIKSSTLAIFVLVLLGFCGLFIYAINYEHKELSKRIEKAEKERDEWKEKWRSTDSSRSAIQSQWRENVRVLDSTHVAVYKDFIDYYYKHKNTNNEIQ